MKRWAICPCGDMLLPDGEELDRCDECGHMMEWYVRASPRPLPTQPARGAASEPTPEQMAKLWDVRHLVARREREAYERGRRDERRAAASAPRLTRPVTLNEFGDFATPVGVIEWQDRNNMATVVAKRDNRDLLPSDYDEAWRVAREAFENAAAIGRNSRTSLLMITEGWIEDFDQALRDEDAERATDEDRIDRVVEA